MYCYALAQSYNCILEELILWANISKEHPTFLLTVAELSGMALNPKSVDALMRMHDQFAEIEQSAQAQRELLCSYGGYYSIPQQLPGLIRRFLQDNDELDRGYSHHASHRWYRGLADPIRAYSG